MDVARFTTLVAQDENLLTLVVGSPVPAELLPAGFSAVGTLRDLPPGVPSEVLLRRPDILQAEQLLKAANANIGAARAAFFPRITLNTSIGTASDQLTGLFSPGSFAWSFAPQIHPADLRLRQKPGRSDRGRAWTGTSFWPGMKRRSRAPSGKWPTPWPRTAPWRNSWQAQQSLTDATSESYRLSQARYERGVDSYLNVLDSQRSLYSAQQGLISVNLTRLSNLVTLYKVLGGGSEQSNPGEKM